MRKVTPTIFIIIFVLLNSCLEDDSLGNHIDYIKYYDIIYPESGYYAQSKFYYDDQARVTKTINVNILGHEVISDYFYSENFLAVQLQSESSPGSFTTYNLTLADDQLTRFTLIEEIAGEGDSDSVDFIYESGKLSVIKFLEDVYQLEVDGVGNIIKYQKNDEQEWTLEYDNHPNPLQYHPSKFIFLTFEEGMDNRLLLPNIIRFFSPNNIKSDNIDYTYRDGKVITIKETNSGIWTKEEFSYRGL